MQVTMGRFTRLPIVVICALTLIAMDAPAVVSGASKPIDNVATEWSYLAGVIICAQPQPLELGPPIEPNIILAQLHLAQWHALIALKNTGACTTQEIVVAFASHKILSNYFPLQQYGRIDPLLYAQLKNLGPSDTQKKLGKQLGQAVALDLIQKYLPGREFALEAMRDALDSEIKNPRPGVWRYLNNTPAGRAAAFFIFYNLPVSQPYVVPDPTVFIKAFLSEVKPPKVPSAEWNEEYNIEKDIGRADWPGRTPEMNLIAVNSGCLKSYDPSTPELTTCNSETTWATVVRASLPKRTSLYDTVVTLAKLHVAMHDALIVLTTLQYGFWFWRPEMAYKTGDSTHAPIPNWTPYIPTPPHPEFPSGAVTSFSAAATILNSAIGKNVPFTIPSGGVWGPFCPIQGPIGSLSFDSYDDFVVYFQKSRLYAGAHFNDSVVDGLKVGDSVGDYVLANWGVEVPAGVLPKSTYLTVFAELPKVQTEFDPIRLVY
ncbi:hypothetical protein KC19_6G139800 [Ceratodon purpureus]|uniref:Vanadium-dependent haloperoxidase NapH1-like second helical-bundle domain-containing protein n=2 Tax=Ceratodon purpureus TaxID=3225 RepID=A0A8T0HGI4_CERPU|nr:hypothetical protein KC19_6G139800 [Ceratodon purpureus]